MNQNERSVVEKASDNLSELISTPAAYGELKPRGNGQLHYVLGLLQALLESNVTEPYAPDIVPPSLRPPYAVDCKGGGCLVLHDGV